MNKVLTSVSLKLQKIFYSPDSVKTFKKMMMMLALVLCVSSAIGSTTMPVSADTTLEGSLGVSEISSDKIIPNVISIIGTVARVVGILLVVYGGYKLVIAMKDQDSNAITTAIVLLAVGAILALFKTIAKSLVGDTVVDSATV